MSAGRKSGLEVVAQPPANGLQTYAPIDRLRRMAVMQLMQGARHACTGGVVLPALLHALISQGAMAPVLLRLKQRPMLGIQTPQVLPPPIDQVGIIEQHRPALRSLAPHSQVFIFPGEIQTVQMDVQRLADPQPGLEDQPEQQVSRVCHAGMTAKMCSMSSRHRLRGCGGGSGGRSRYRVGSWSSPYAAGSSGIGTGWQSACGSGWKQPTVGGLQSMPQRRPIRLPAAVLQPVLHGRSGRPLGHPLQAWSAGMYVCAYQAVRHGRVPALRLGLGSGGAGAVGTS